jgi:hypothetical protein
MDDICSGQLPHVGAPLQALSPLLDGHFLVIERASDPSEPPLLHRGRG